MSLDPATRARLVGLFVAEGEENLESLRRLAAQLRTGDGGEALGEFGRIAHGLKGAAAALCYEELARALHCLEDLAGGLRDEEAAGAEARHERIGWALDLLAQGLARMSATGSDAFPPDVLDGLSAIVAPGAPPAPGEGRSPSRPLSSASAEPDLAGSRRSGPRAGGEAIERLSVPAADVDEALRMAALLARAAAQLQESLSAGGQSVAAAHALAASAAGLEGLIAALRLIPADAALSGLEEEIASLAKRLGKEVVPELAGRDVRADRRTLQTARGLIRHLIRNALDHGIEPPSARAAAGKPRAGRVAVSVETIESALRVEVADDGAGFDVPAIRAELARRAGDAAPAQTLADEEVLQLWAFEGGTTRASSTDISGRGLGLSAVARVAREIGGGIQIRSVRGLGSAVVFTLPLEVYAVEALTLVAAGRTFALPLSAVERAIHLPAAGEAVRDGPSGRTVAVGETILPLVSLAEATGAGRSAGRERFVVVVRAEGGAAALLAEDVGAVTGVVPASVPGVAHADALIAGLARLADGTPLALLNPRHLLARARSVRAGTSAQAASGPRTAAAVGARSLEVVLAEDSLATREVLRVLLEEQGFRVRLAGDGEEALERIAEAIPDVLVSDVNMPRRDGLSLARALRARRDTERLPIVLLTSQDDPATRAAGAAAGADAYLVKSQFTADVLAATLARLGVSAP